MKIVRLIVRGFQVPFVVAGYCWALARSGFMYGVYKWDGPAVGSREWVKRATAQVFPRQSREEQND